jgi:hypothetical protein
MHGPFQSRETVPLILTLFYTRGLGIVALHGSLTYSTGTPIIFVGKFW